MDECRAIVANNLIRLRLMAGLTQAELGDQLNYSDKSISKWERGDAVPDVFVLKQIAEIYGVTVDYLLQSHDGTEPAEAPGDDGYSTTTITVVSVLGIWTLAVLIFVILWITGKVVWQIFVYAVPVSLITLLVLHSIWRGGRWNQFIIAALVLSLLVTVYLTLLPMNPWQLFLIAIPAELVVFLSFRIKRGKKRPVSPIPRETEPEE